MTRRKYIFTDRAAAEEAYLKADRRRLAAEWFASAILQGRTVRVGTAGHCGQRLTVGYFTTRHSAWIYATKKCGPPHCIYGIWGADSPELDAEIESNWQYQDFRDLACLLENARVAANQALLEAA